MWREGVLSITRTRGWWGSESCMGRTKVRSNGQGAWLLNDGSRATAALAIGTAAALTVLGAGLSLIKFHGGIWPWWFHGLSVALITGLITTLFMHFHLREVSRREERRLAGERLSHEVCTALQILFQCTYLQPEQRSQLEGEAITRLHVAARELLPNLLEIASHARPVASSFVGEGQSGNRAAAAGSR